MTDCPTCKHPMALVKVSIEVSKGKAIPTWSFSGWLCGSCRKIWSPTEVSDAIDLRMLT